MTFDIPAAWQQALSGIASGGGTCLVLGRVDSGKTTFCTVLARHALGAGVKVALVDADPGQSDIGPPAAVGMALVRDPQQLMEIESISADALSFVGTTSPAGHLLQLAAATAEMVERAHSGGAQLVIVDTCGLVDGGIGRALKAAKVHLLRARHIVALQRKNDIEHLLAPYRRRSEPQTWRLPISRRARPRDRDERKAKRERQFAAYFRGATSHEFAWDDVGLEQTTWLTGQRAPGQVAAYVEQMTAAEVLYAERVETGTFAIVKGLGGVAHRTIKGEEGEIRAVDARLLENLLLGLMDATGRTVALGILTSVDFKRRRFTILAPIASLEQVRGIKLGSMRVGPDGAELGYGEIA